MMKIRIEITCFGL